MAVSFTKFGYVAGVLAKAYRNRTDLQKYDLALAQGKNWFIDYQGGLSTRPGLEFHDYIMNDNLNVLIAPFQFSYEVSNTYLVLFGHQYIRFLQQGAYVLEASQAVTNVAADVITIAAHGLQNGDWIKPRQFDDPTFNLRTLKIANRTVNTFTLETVDGVAVPITGWVSGGTISRIYTIATTFTSSRLEGIVTHQLGDTLRIISRDSDFIPYSLTRIGSANWTLTREDFLNSVTVPVNLVGDGDTSTTGAPAASTVIFAVTAVDTFGEESLPSLPLFITSIRNYANTTGYARVEWDPVPGARYYNVYRSIIAEDANMSAAQQLGYVGRAYGATFTDNNVVPDFSVTPPTGINPFANAGIDWIDVTAPGTGYTNLSVVSVVGAPGSGFRGFPVVSKSGELLAVVVVNSGQDYVSPVVTVTVGTGATFNVELTEDEGNKPSAGCVFQQRQIYAGTVNRPLGVNGSKPGLYSNFDVSGIILDNDAYSFDIDSPIHSRIKHLVPTKAGLLITTAAGLWQLVGSASAAVTATDAGADRQSAIGIADVPPLEINEDLAVLDSENRAVRLLAYSDFQKNYISNDISILSNHYFSARNPITSWTYCGGPHRLIYATRRDGALIVGCIVKEHEIYAWTDWATQGYFRQVVRLRENTRDRCYCIVERDIDGVNRKFIESFATRTTPNAESYIGLDSALTLGGNAPAGACTPSALTGEITVTSSSGYFTNAMVGWRWRGGGGRGTLTDRLSSGSATILLDTAITEVKPESTIPATLSSGDWYLDEPVTTITGLDHLEGATVSALFDGQPYHDLVVVDGALTPGFEFTRAVVGLKFTCVGQALPVSDPRASVEFDRKRIVALGLWQEESRGVKFGTREGKLYEPKVRTTEGYLELMRLHTGVVFVSVEPEWKIDDSYFFVQNDPLPATLLGVVVQAEIGDDDDRN